MPLTPDSWTYKYFLKYVMNFFSEVNWDFLYRKKKLADPLLTAEEIVALKKVLDQDYYIICSVHYTHLSYWLISIAQKIKRGTWAKWGHVFMNYDYDKTDKPMFCEATGRIGVRVIGFEELMAGDGFVLLKPKNLDLDKFTSVIDAGLKKNIGKPYDDLFDMQNQTRLSCVELVLVVLEQIPGYKDFFKKFFTMQKTIKTITPDSYPDCGDFEELCSVRRKILWVPAKKNLSMLTK